MSFAQPQSAFRDRIVRWAEEQIPKAPKSQRPDLKRVIDRIRRLRFQETKNLIGGRFRPNTDLGRMYGLLGLKLTLGHGHQ